MTFRDSILVFTLAALLFVFELLIFRSTGMRPALHFQGLSMVAAYKFLWLMVFTAAVGILAPVGALIGSVTRRKNFAVASWAFLIMVSVIGFTTLSFLKARSFPNSSAKEPSPPSPSPQQASSTSPVGTEAATPLVSSLKLREVVEFLDSKVEQAGSDQIRVILRFRNKSIHRIKDLDYSFSFLGEKDRVIVSIDFREGLQIPPSLVGESTLNWTKSGFNDPAQFDQLSQEWAKGTLKVAVTLQRATLSDGTVVQG